MLSAQTNQHKYTFSSWQVLVKSYSHELRNASQKLQESMTICSLSGSYWCTWNFYQNFAGLRSDIQYVICECFHYRCKLQLQWSKILMRNKHCYDACMGNACRMTDWLTNWQSNWLPYWLIDYLAGQLTDRNHKLTNKNLRKSRLIMNFLLHRKPWPPMA